MPSTNIGGHASNRRWPTEPTGVGGSHISDPAWARIALCVSGGMDFWAYILYDNDEALTTQDEDLRWLAWEAQVQRLGLRLMHGYGVRLPTPAQRRERFVRRVARTLEFFPSVRLKGINEPENELLFAPDGRPIQTLAEVYDHNAELRRLFRIDFGNRVDVSSPCIAPRRGDVGLTSLAEAKRRVAEFDHWGIHYYPRSIEEVTAGEWSLAWQLAQIPTGLPTVIWEWGAEKRTPPELRNQILPLMAREIVRNRARAVDSAWFVVETSDPDPEMQEHVWQGSQLISVLQVAEHPEAVPPVVPPVRPGNVDLHQLREDMSAQDALAKACVDLTSQAWGYSREMQDRVKATWDKYGLEQA